MKKILCATVLLFAFASLSYAQGTLFVGYSNLQVQGLTTNPGNDFAGNFFDRREGLHGVEASYTAHFAKFFGITGDFSFHRHKDTFDFIGGQDTLDTQVYNFMAGPEVKLRNRSHFEPFAHALFGGSHTRFKASTRSDTFSGSFTDSFTTNTTDFAIAVGGGLDIRFGGRLGVRLIQVDYLPVFLRDQSINALTSAGVIEPFLLNGQRQDNIRISAGIIF